MKSMLMKKGITLAALLACAGVHANIVSLNLYMTSNDVQRIDHPETYGVPALDTVVGNWNNPGGNSGSNLRFDDGTQSSVGFTIVNNGGRQSLNAAYDNTALKAGMFDYTTTPTDTTLTFNNLTANFANGFYAIVYVNSFLASTGASISDGSTTYYFIPKATPNASLVEITDTNSGDGYQVGNYAVFGSEQNPLTNNSVTFQISAISGGGAAIGGVQLVAIPEPATLGLLSGLGGAILFLRRIFLV